MVVGLAGSWQRPGVPHPPRLTGPPKVHRGSPAPYRVPCALGGERQGLLPGPPLPTCAHQAPPIPLTPSPTLGWAAPCPPPRPAHPPRIRPPLLAALQPSPTLCTEAGDCPAKDFIAFGPGRPRPLRIPAAQSSLVERSGSPPPTPCPREDVDNKRPRRAKANRE